MNININVIFTFEDKPQRFVYVEANHTVLNSKDRFFTRLVHNMSKAYKQKLVKISCSIDFSKLERFGKHEIISDNHWYFQCNGKFWDDEIPGLMKDLFDVDITYVPTN